MSKKEFMSGLAKHGLYGNAVEEFIDHLTLEGRVQPFDFENYIGDKEAEKIFESLQ